MSDDTYTVTIDRRITDEGTEVVSARAAHRGDELTATVEFCPPSKVCASLHGLDGNNDAIRDYGDTGVLSALIPAGAGHLSALATAIEDALGFETGDFDGEEWTAAYPLLLSGGEALLRYVSGPEARHRRVVALTANPWRAWYVESGDTE